MNQTLKINGIVITMSEETNMMYYQVPEDLTGKEFDKFKKANIDRINQFFNRPYGKY